MERVRLIQFTDPHLYGDARGTLRGVETYPALQAAIAHARAHHWPCDAVLATGDLVQDDPSGYPRFKEVFGELGVPVFCIPGNHDDPAALRQNLQEPPFQVGGVARWAGWFGVMLDSCMPGQAGGQLSAESLRQLDQTLAENKGQHGLVCLHHHPVAMDSRWLDQVGLENAAEFFEVLDRHRNVRAVLWGHVHQQYDEIRNGVKLLGTPSTCAQFLPHSDSFAIDRKPPGYRWLELTPEGGIDSAVAWVEGAGAF